MRGIPRGAECEIEEADDAGVDRRGVLHFERSGHVWSSSLEPQDVDEAYRLVPGRGGQRFRKCFEAPVPEYATVGRTRAVI